MLGKMRKMLKSQEGFTLIELITVLVILAVIMAIGIPKYMMIQQQAEYDTDENAIRSYAKMAEVYSAQNGHAKSVGITDLCKDGMINGDTTLNRKKTGTGTSSPNNDGTKVSSYTKVAFVIDAKGNVTKASVDAAITDMIGKRPS